MNYATVQHGTTTIAGAIESDMFRPFIPFVGDVAAAIPFLLAGKLELGAPVPLIELKLCAPILKPPHNIICVGTNYRAHAEEFLKSSFSSGNHAENAIPQHPIVFTKPASTINAPEGAIPLIPGLDKAVDYEAELAVIIGKGGRNIHRDAAMEHVFGYTLINDITARDLQQQHKQWFLGKSIDGFCPMGPWVIPADTVDYQELRITCHVNGELRQNASLRDLIFDIPTLIETISEVMTLASGDIIATGTPEGVGIAFTPPKFLHDGDVVTCEVSEIGTLRNTARLIS